LVSVAVRLGPFVGPQRPPIWPADGVRDALIPDRHRRALPPTIPSRSALRSRPGPGERPYRAGHPPMRTQESRRAG